MLTSDTEPVPHCETSTAPLIQKAHRLVGVSAGIPAVVQAGGGNGAPLQGTVIKPGSPFVPIGEQIWIGCGVVDSHMSTWHCAPEGEAEHDVQIRELASVYEKPPEQSQLAPVVQVLVTASQVSPAVAHLHSAGTAGPPNPVLPVPAGHWKTSAHTGLVAESKATKK
jgi:hypothetical protein